MECYLVARYQNQTGYALHEHLYDCDIRAGVVKRLRVRSDAAAKIAQVMWVAVLRLK